jgi:hypothetical protein
MLRAADAMLRVLGGSDVALRLPVYPAATATQVELGLAAPQLLDVPLAPAAVLSLAAAADARLRYELLVSASATDAAVEAYGLSSAQDLFNSAVGVIFNGKLLRIERLAVDIFGGIVSLYRLTLTE